MFCTFILVSWLTIVHWDVAFGLRNFVYQKDMSEFCRRRAMPSVFLSRQVLDTNSQMLHFSKLDLPYSCFTSIRTEASSNIIMVVQLMNSSDLLESCNESGNQLVVYEIGETYGGYWGPMPEAVMQQEPIETRTYTLQHHEPVNLNHFVELRDEFPTTTSTTRAPPTQDPRPAENSDDNFITWQVPLVNITNWGSDKKMLLNRYNAVQVFDDIYDVRPRPYTTYETSLIPLMQFSMMRERNKYGLRGEEEPIYELAYNLGAFTPDYRYKKCACDLSVPCMLGTVFDGLTTPIFSARSWKNKNGKPWKKKKLLNTLTRNNASLFKERKSEIGTSFRGNYILPTNQNRHTTYDHVLSQEMPKIFDDPPRKETISADSVGLIEDILKSLNKSQDYAKKPRLSYESVLHNISDMHHNFSAYLLPWSTYTYVPVTHVVYNLTKESSVSLPASGTQENTPSFSSQVQPTKYVNPMWEKNKSTQNYKQATSDGKISSNLNEENNNTSINLTKYRTVGSFNTTQYKTMRISSKTRNAEAVESVTTSRTTKHVDTGSSRVLNQNVKGTLVDHQSWENVVQVAPMLAGVLNRPSPGAPQSLVSSRSPGVHRSLGAPRLSETHRSPKANRSPVTQSLQGHDRPPGEAPGLRESPISLGTHLNRPRPMPHERRRRTVEPIPILNAKPHTRPTSRQRSSTTRTTPPVADSLHFAQLLEIPDDEMSSHLALRFIRQYAGARVYNICDQFDIAGRNRHVVLFNSSRILLAIGNFTIPRITVVMTTANALRPLEPRCPDDTIECQVAGARVCIDSASACDGIPNCGAHDLYDEDRLQCGVTMGFQHSVCLAAMTFLMVILTMICIVHYWLNRCVPKVADAFFVYTDGAENVLYLDTIMRAPTDTELGAEAYVFDHSSFEDNINIPPIATNGSRKHKGCCRRLFARCLRRFKHRKKKRSRDSILNEDSDEIQKTKKEMPVARKLYSFTEFELSKMDGTFKKDESVQTGESLEMAFLKMINSFRHDSYPNTKPAYVPPRKPFKPEPINQLLLRKSKREPSTSSEAPGFSDFHIRQADDRSDDEKEIQSTLYDPPSHRVIAGRSSKDMGLISTSNAKKHLRFEENARYISAPQEPAEPVPQQREGSAASARQSSTLGPAGSKQASRRNINSLETLSQESELPPSIDFKRFFRVKKKKLNK